MTVFDPCLRGLSSGGAIFSLNVKAVDETGAHSMVDSTRDIISLWWGIDRA
jgi:hypothetical protein